MALTIAITLIAVGALTAVTLIKGFERALPFFAFLVVLLPWEARIDFGGWFILTTTRALITTFAVLYVTSRDKNSQCCRPGKLPLKWLLLLYLAWCGVSTLNSIAFGASVKAVVSIALDFYVVYYVYAKSISSVETVRKVLSASLAALVVCCLLGMVERFTEWKVSDLFPAVMHRFTPGVEGVSVDTGRLTSTFPHAILFANALTLGIPWALYLLSEAKSAAQKFYLWIAIVVLFYNLYRTQSRGPWLALVLSLSLLFLFSQSNIRKALLVISLLTASALIIRPGVWQTLEGTYWATLDSDSPRGSSYQYRYDLRRLAREALAKSPSRAVWGFGPDSFYDLGLEEMNPNTGHLIPFDSCDSAFVGIMVETGYVGLFLVTLLLIRIALFSLRGFIRLERPMNLLSLVFLINVLAYAFMMVSVENFGWGQQTHMLWITIALAMVYPGLVQPTAIESNVTPIVWMDARPQLAEIGPSRA